MRRGIKIYGTFNGILPEDFATLRESLNFDEVEYEPNTVSIEHTGYYNGVEDVIMDVMEAMQEGKESGLDIIDHEENEITRFVIESDGFRSKTLDLDNVVEVYPTNQPQGLK